MALFDMPKEKLFEYMGSSPCPADFDEFWADALAELDTFDPDPEFVPAKDFSCKSADCYDLFFTGTKGARVHAKFLKPKNIDGKIPAVMAYHGYTSQSGSWNRNLKFIAEGMAIARLDCRGQGEGISEDRGGYKRVWNLELSDAYTGLREFFRDCDPMHLKEDEFFNKLGYIDVQNFAHKINAEVLMATALMDATCPPSTQFAFYNKLNCKKDVIFFPEYGHIYLRGWEDIAFKKLMEFNEGK